MTKLTKRGNTYVFDQTIGGRRIRVSTGLKDPAAAKRIATQISFALADGPRSDAWKQLRLVLPPSSFKTLTEGFDVMVDSAIEDFFDRFWEKLLRRVKLDEISESTRKMYDNAAWTFYDWLRENSVRKMDEVTPEVVEKYLIWRKADIESNPRSKNGRGLGVDGAALSAVFKLAVEEKIMEKSPLGKIKLEGEVKGAEPFTKEEMGRMNVVSHVYENYTLPFLLFRWTGLRISDVAELTWSSINWTDSVLVWKTKKRSKLVVIPLKDELREMLAQRVMTQNPEDKILPHMSLQRLRNLIHNLGVIAGVDNPNAHRFRDSLAMYLIERGATPFDVSQILGDSISVLEKHYFSKTVGLQERVRSIMEQEEK